MRNDFRQVDAKLIQSEQTIELYERAIKAIDVVGWRKYVSSDGLLKGSDGLLKGTPNVKVAITGGLCIMEALAVAAHFKPDTWSIINVPESLYAAVIQAQPNVALQSGGEASRVAFYNDEYCAGGDEAKQIFRRAIELEQAA